jgi:WD40 repeat protein
VIANSLSVKDVNYSPDGQIVATGGAYGVRLWSAADGSLIRAIPSFNEQAVTHVAFSPDSQLIAASEEGYGNNVEIWKVTTGELVRTLAGDPEGFCAAVAFSNDGHVLASTSGYTYQIRFWDVASGNLLQTYDHETGSGIQHGLPITFQPGGSLFGYGRADATVDMATNPFAL